ncbi:hypothetical protein KUCAC02_012009 [Chaenocephalus aceratus]|uniref:Uncharacterized protein n=1 Tax=Chaenocephalus aceratus TaxID=36190 RepID=A0ACB9XA68_CHAAC|nr:hypothetical protein KUCAC02_012009 [Chaenocephalus aceratus]
MFMYWKKRGAYELETLPPSLTQGGTERYSWSSSLDVIHDLRALSDLARRQPHMRGKERMRPAARPATWKSGDSLVSLEPVPAEADRLAQTEKRNATERNSEALIHDKPVQEEDWVVCQHPECHERRRASKPAVAQGGISAGQSMSDATCLLGQGRREVQKLRWVLYQRRQFDPQEHPSQEAASRQTGE